ncbi:MAG: hypothetical protein Q7J20_05350 [Candidatus Nitrotoga sp.]|nr:hypothetical protein [Candidatus Nitrotoga sp.]MDO9447312.1 hypothetical protein [Candidatus Nitrotoga sp.]
MNRTDCEILKEFYLKKGCREWTVYEINNYCKNSQGNIEDKKHMQDVIESHEYSDKTYYNRKYKEAGFYTTLKLSQKAMQKIKDETDIP